MGFEGDSPARFFSDPEVGQIPSCSYRSKKDELVGGAFSDMLVDLDRGSSTAPDALRLTTGELLSLTGVVIGAAGRGVEGGGVIDPSERCVLIDGELGVVGRLFWLGADAKNGG